MLGRSWGILAVLFAARAATGFQFQSTGSATNLLMTDLGIGYAEVGMLLGAYLLPGVLVAFPTGLLGRRVSDKTLGLAGLVLMPFLIVLSPFLIYLLRTKEESDPELCPPLDRAVLLELQHLEDYDVSNQYTALGSLKPGLFRRWLGSGLLVLIDYAARHVFTHGFLARVQTIHFAFWAFLDDKRRVVFTSNYDGGHEAYMDDFINKAAWGLNLAFSHGVGWPRTRWLIARGARIEHKFKNYQRRHQQPTELWYRAYPGLTLADLKRNQRIREGLEPAHVTDAQAEAWLRLL